MSCKRGRVEVCVMGGVTNHIKAFKLHLLKDQGAILERYWESSFWLLHVQYVVCTPTQRSTRCVHSCMHMVSL